MASVGIFVGSSGGVTQEAAEKLEELFDGAELINMTLTSLTSLTCC